MTREDAISVLERVAHTESKWPGTEDTLEALDMAISALRQPDVTDKDVGKMTNAQKIRAMSDEELTEFLIDLADDGNLRIGDWLQKSAEEDKHETD